MDRTKYNIFLDIIRICAIAGVVSCHAGIYIPTGNLHDYLVYGKYGVQIFFVLSGYLCVASGYHNAGIWAYYRKRAVRILPAYYISIICGMLVHYVLLKDVTQDSLYLGWLRYFLGLNIILPSSNYALWNNMYGLWSMSCFIGLYLMAPFIFRYVRSLKHAILFMGFAVLLKDVWEEFTLVLFAGRSNFEELYWLIGASPFGKLYQFCFGIMVFFFIKEKKVFEGIVVLCCALLIGEVLGLTEVLWCALTSILILAVNFLSYHNSQVEKIISFLGKESYHVYLSHFVAYDVARCILIKIVDKTSFSYIVWWAIIAVACTWILCIFMNLAEKIVNHLFNKNGG